MMKLNPAATITEEFAERIKSENRSAKMMKLAPLIVLACLVVVFLIVCGASFLSPKNIMNILNQMALPLVVALGLTFVIMLGSIDLSIDGSVGMAGSLFACFVLNSEFAYDLGFLSVVIAVGVSMLCGLLIGLCGAIVAFFLQWLLYAGVAQGIANSDTLQLLKVVAFQKIWLPVAVVFGGVGILVGVGGSLTAIRKFLQV